MTATIDAPEELGGKPTEGTKKDKRLHENTPPADAATQDVETFAPTASGTGNPFAQAQAVETFAPMASGAGDTMMAAEQWEGVLIVEGSPTGDGRQFAVDSVTWPDPSTVTLTLQWQKESSHGGDHDVTVACGRIDRIWRDGNLIRGAGQFDLGSEDGREAFRRMDANMLTGVSINADDITDADVEYIFPEGDGDAEDEGDIISLLFARPEKIIFHKARLRAATLCDIPAYVEAVLHTIPVDGGATALVASAVAAAQAALHVEPHSTRTSDGPWDPAVAEAVLPERLGAMARDFYGWVNPAVSAWEDVTRKDCRFLHHELGGKVASANLAACRTGISVLNTATTDLSEDQRRAVYDHLTQHLRDGGQEPEPFVNRLAVTAAAWQEQMWRAPASWFNDPGITVPTPIIVNDSGRLFGLASEWGQCHLGYQNECIMAPREEYHSYYLTGNQPVDNGADVPVGTITAGIGHASLTIGSWQRAAEHYDNTAAVVAHVAMGNCKAGIWVAGAITPWAEPARVAALRASGQVSPDWRKIGGQLRMVGLLTVNVSGFQTAAAKPSVRTHLAADGRIDAMVASGMVSARLQTPQSEADLDRRALRLMQDRLAERVHRKED